MCVYWSSKGKKEYCLYRRRMKRSVATTISQAYGELYSDLIDRREMENFLRFDLNRDGLVSLEEANRSNATIEEVKQVDANNEQIYHCNDGFVHTAEFDASLIFKDSKEANCANAIIGDFKQVIVFVNLL